LKSGKSSTLFEKDPPAPHSEAVSVSSAPLFTFTIGSLLLPYVLLELILSLSEIVREPLSYLFRGLGYGTYFLLGKFTHGAQILEYIGFGLVQIGGVADTILYWCIFLILGWPLFKDILVFFGVSTSDMGVKATFKTMKDWRGFSRKLRDGQE
jgi:hypothetical protein